MLRLSNSNVSLIQGLIALKGLKTTLRLVLYKAWYLQKAWRLKASLEFENKWEDEGEEEKTLLLRAPLVAIGAQKHTTLLLSFFFQNRCGDGKYPLIHSVGHVLNAC